MDEDEQYRQAFGEQNTSISARCRDLIGLIKENYDYRIKGIHVERDDADAFTDQAWELLGRYIANNTNMVGIILDDGALTDEKVALLFRGLTRSVSLKQLYFDNNEISIVGLRSMVPFLRNTTNRLELYLRDNSDINTECFELVISTLNGKPVKGLHFGGCNITDISSLETYNLPDIEELSLSRNNIGR